MALLRSLRPLHISTLLCLALPLFASACGDDDALVTDASMPDSGDEDDAGTSEPARCDALDEGALSDPEACTPASSDYAPNADDAWDGCISDDGEYHPIESSISTNARIDAFEQIADLLLDPASEPSPDEFLEARMLYQLDEGLDSRVVRRYDPHVEVPDGTDCALPETVDAFPEHCVGPARLQPLLLRAFNAGITGEAPREQAARIEAALLYFLYVSTYKESLTCTDAPKDCDSAYAYYTGGEAARGGSGLSRYVQAASPEAHERAWDGLLAVRCWRDLDDAVPAADLELRERARTQYDVAVLQGLAAVLRQRIIALGVAACDEAHQADYVFVSTLASLLDGAVRSRDEAAADALHAALEPSALDLEAALSALDTTLACP